MEAENSVGFIPTENSSVGQKKQGLKTLSENTMVDL
jgi:hypothetical protein